MWNEVTILWNELTILWNDLTTDWNDLTWNDLTMERNDRIPIVKFLLQQRLQLSSTCRRVAMWTSRTEAVVY